MELRGAVVVVTGASAGIGEATAVAFARRGAKVVLAARRKDRLDVLADRIGGAGGIALAVRCDVAEPTDLVALAATTRDAFGGADVLVNNAGIPGGGAFTELSTERIEQVVRVNLLGVLHGTHAFLPGMRVRGRGHVVNVASLAGRFATPGAEVYTATKHAVVAFSEALDYATAAEGVRITSVNPAFVPTEAFTAQTPSLVTLDVDRVAGAIVHVVRSGIAPEYSIPRWVGPFQAFRVLTPPLYRWGVRRVRHLAARSTTRPAEPPP